MEGIGIFIIFGMIFIAVIILNIIQTRKRREELTAFCMVHDLKFDPSNDSSIEEQFPNFKCLQQGDDRYAYNMMSGAWSGRPLLAFDYHYETHSTDSKGRRQTHDHHFSAVILSSAVPLKALTIRPEGFFDKVTEFFGYDDIDFESSEFSRTFHVTAEDKKWAFDVIHPRTMEFLMSGPRLWMQFDQYQVMAWHPGSRFSAAEFETAVRLAEGVLDRLPGYLVKQQTGEG